MGEEHAELWDNSTGCQSKVVPWRDSQWAHNPAKRESSPIHVCILDYLLGAK